MFKMKKLAAVAAAAIMAVSAMALSVGAYDGTTAYTSQNFSDTKTTTQDNGYRSTLSVYYMYGASSTGKADLICNYGYGDTFCYKYATIAYGTHSVGAGNYDGVTSTTVKTTTDTITPNSSANSSITYGGYCKASQTDSTKKYSMTYTLKLTV